MDLYVNRQDLHETRLVDVDSPSLEPGQARLRVERFGLSANNITYAVMGDMMQYWDFFPAEQGWGRVPVWGYAEVSESAHGDLSEGTRLFGYLPMSDELVITAGKVDGQGVTDVSEHRRPMAGAYNRYRIADATMAPGSEGEDQRMLLFPLFFTSFLVDDFLADNGWFGASKLVISSASSKTALGIARQAKARNEVEVIGLTSEGNREFAEGLGVFDSVLLYGDEASLPDGPAAYVDVSGSGEVRTAVHARYGEDLVHDMILGGTHWEEMGGGGSPMAGAQPELFFAPSQVSKRNAEWGQAQVDEKFDQAWTSFAPWAANWIEFHHDSGLDAAARVYLELLDNRADPRMGHILSPRPATGPGSQS